MFIALELASRYSKFNQPSVSRDVLQRATKSSNMAEDYKGKSNNASERRQDPISAEEMEGTSKSQAASITSTSKRTNACTPDNPSYTTRAELTTQSQN